MPLYEFQCRECDTVFTKRRTFANSHVTAPCECGSDDTFKLLSTIAFSVGGASRASSSSQSIDLPMMGGGCCGGSCGCSH